MIAVSINFIRKPSHGCGSSDWTARYREGANGVGRPPPPRNIRRSSRRVAHRGSEIPRSTGSIHRVAETGGIPKDAVHGRSVNECPPSIIQLTSVALSKVLADVEQGSFKQALSRVEGAGSQLQLGLRWTPAVERVQAEARDLQRKVDFQF